MVVNVSGNHWVWLLILPKLKVILGFNSIDGSLRKLCPNVFAWLAVEARINGVIFVIGDWCFSDVEDRPRQLNGYDCGVFVIMMIEYIIDNLPLSFQQSDMPFFRQRLAVALLIGLESQPDRPIAGWTPLSEENKMLIELD